MDRPAAEAVATVLNVVADDGARAILSQALRNSGFEVREARSAEEALQLAQQVPALILLDIGLPPSARAEVSRCFRAAAIPVMHVSTSGMDGAMPPVDSLGEADLVLAAPMHPEVVVAGAKVLLRAHQAERLFHGFLEAASDAVALADPAGELVHVNKRAEELFGYARAEMLGRSFDFLMPERFRSQHDRAFRGYLADPRPRRMGEGLELLGLTKAGVEFPIDIALSPLQTDAGLVVAAAIRDMTEYRGIEAELRRRTRDLEAADLNKDQFVTILAHELRTPLAAVRQTAHLLRLPLASERLEQVAGVVERQTGHMLRLIDELLDLTQVRSGLLALQVVQVDLGQMVAEAVEISQPSFDARTQCLSIELPARPIVVSGDAARLLQVIVNLLANAAKYTPVHGHIEVSLEVDGPDAVLRVRDDGIGISPPMLARVFDMFTQGDRTSAGLGIGLTLVRRFVEMHQGSVVAESMGLGQGSAFIVRLPVLVG